MADKNQAITQEMPVTSQPVQKSRKAKKLAFFIILLLILSGLFYYLFWYAKTESYKQKKADKESAELIKEVGEMMILPPGKPAIFTVQDPDLLAGQQAFFKGAEKGDSLIVYSEAGKAIIYSKKRNLIVNVGPVTFDQSKDQKTIVPVVPKPVEIKTKN
jgi:flagellar biosynthesis/type III secretory pathway M-ring protein FliF/YscJ